MEHNNSYNWHLCFSPSSPVLQSQNLEIERLFLHFCSIRTNEYELNQSTTYISYCVPFLRNSLSVSASFVWRHLNNLFMDNFTSPPSSNRAYGCPVRGFPMFFMPRHAAFSRELSSEVGTIYNAHTTRCWETLCI